MAGSVNKECERCGRSFCRPNKYSNAQWLGRRFCSKRCGAKKINTPDSDIALIYSRGSSSTEIANMFGMSQTHALRTIKAGGGKIRSASEGMKISHSRLSTLDKLSAASKGRKHSETTKDKLRAKTGPMNAQWRNGLTVSVQGYLTFSASPANGTHARKPLHVVVAEWAIGRALKTGEIVHHKDRNKLNNDPKNLEVMTASEHATLHFNAGEFKRKKNA